MNEETINKQVAIASIKALYPDMPIVDIMDARKKWREKYAAYIECENILRALPPATSAETVTEKARNNMYESPINIIFQNIEGQIALQGEQTEQEILEVVRRLGIDVNKDELVKAINYDRNQYNEGYADGVNGVLDMIRADIDQLPTITRINRDGGFSEVEYVDVTRDQLLEIIRSKYFALNPIYYEMMAERSNKDE